MSGWPHEPALTLSCDAGMAYASIWSMLKEMKCSSVEKLSKPERVALLAARSSPPLLASGIRAICNREKGRREGVGMLWVRAGLPRVRDPLERSQAFRGVSVAGKWRSVRKNGCRGPHLHLLEI